MIDLSSDRFAMSSAMAPDTIEGTRGDDRLDGTNHADLIEGLGGDDLIQGLGGADSLAGGGGDDTLLGGSGDDTLDGGLRTDSMSGGSGDDLIFVDHISNHRGYSIWSDLVDGGSGFDTVSFAQAKRPVILELYNGELDQPDLTGIEKIVGTGFDDAITGYNTHAAAYDGGAGDDTIQSIYGDDTLAGGDGADRVGGGRHCVVEGGGGRDSLYGFHFSTIDGGAGDDLIQCGTLGDQVVGGKGADTFQIVLEQGDVFTEIGDLEAHDTIDLHYLDADTTHSGDQAFVLVASLDGHAGEATLAYDAGTDRTSLLFDTDGDGAADLTVLLAGDHTGFSSFVL